MIQSILTIFLSLLLFHCAGTNPESKPTSELSYENKDRFEYAVRNYLNSLKGKDSGTSKSISEYEFYNTEAKVCKERLDNAKESGMDLSSTMDFSYLKTAAAWDYIDPEVAKVIPARILYSKCLESINVTQIAIDQKLKSQSQARQDDRITEYGEVLFEFSDKPKGKPKSEFACGDTVYTNIVFKNYVGSSSSLWVVMKSNGVELNGPQGFLIFLPTKYMENKKFNESYEYLLTPTGAMAKKETDKYRDPTYTAFYHRLLRAPAGQKTFTFEMSSGAVAKGEITINCDDFSKSPYVTALNDFEEGLIEGRMFPTQNFHKELVPAILKDYSSCAEPDCKVKLVKVLHQAEEIFGTKENGKYTNITGQGYAYAGGVQLANGKCMMERGIYYKPWDGRVFESRYTSWIKSSEGIKCPNIK